MDPMIFIYCRPVDCTADVDPCVQSLVLLMSTLHFYIVSLELLCLTSYAEQRSVKLGPLSLNASDTAGYP